MRARRKAALAAILFAALVLAAFNAGWWWYYRSITEFLERQLSHRLTGAAAAAALHIPASDVDALLIENLDTYARQLEYLDSLARIDSLSEAAIIDLDFSYLISTREDISREGYLLARLNFDTLNQAIQGHPAASALYNVDGTFLKSAYAPLYNSQGDVAAILVVEAGAGYFGLLASLRNNLVVLAGGSVAAMILLLVIYIMYNRRMAAAEEKLFQAGSQAALGRMVAVVSHEIKNPLMILNAAGERLAQKYADPEASFIVDEIARLDNIVSGYLSFARGDTVLQLDSVDLPSICQKLVVDFKPQFDRQGADLTLDCAEAIPPLKADPVGLRQIIINLLLNALQAVDIEAKNRPEKVVRIRIEKSADKVILQVSDNGPGIKPALREKLFEPFFTTKIQGSGLGLYLSRRIVEQHGGELKITDRFAGMTTFEVTLPAGERL